MRLPDVILGGMVALAVAACGARPALSEATAEPSSAGLLSASSANVAPPAAPPGPAAARSVPAATPEPAAGMVTARAGDTLLIPILRPEISRGEPQSGEGQSPSAPLSAPSLAGAARPEAPGIATASSFAVPDAVPDAVPGALPGALPHATSGAASPAPPHWSVSHLILPAEGGPEARRQAHVVITLAPPLRPARILHDPLPVATAAPLRPRPREELIGRPLPAMRWDHRPDAALWTSTTIAAVRAAGLTEVIPADISTWCPAYRRADPQDRAAFWSGLLSALARYESTHNPRAVGGGGLYFGLLQILPSTARQYGCTARSGEALRDGPANLACAVRIAAENVIRDAAVAREDGRNAGLARDWGPMTVASRRAEMADWTRAQTYCTLPTIVLAAPLPPARPWTLVATSHGHHAGTVSLALLSDDIRDLRAIPPPTPRT